MNDVLHHCARKNNEELKQSLESVAVEMFCAGWVAAGADEATKDQRQAKFTKLIKLWEDKSIFSPSTLAKMKDPGTPLGIKKLELITLKLVSYVQVIP